MSFFQWNQNLVLGVQKMDGEHQQLVGLMNQLFEANERKLPKQEIVSAFKALADYTVKHFADEEAYMESVGFPDIEKHKIIHKDLLSKVGAHFEGFKNGGTLVDQSVFDFLNLWLKAHIMGLDMKYAHHALKKAG